MTEPVESRPKTDAIYLQWQPLIYQANQMCPDRVVLDESLKIFDQIYRTDDEELAEIDPITDLEMKKDEGLQSYARRMSIKIQYGRNVFLNFFPASASEELRKLPIIQQLYFSKQVELGVLAVDLLNSPATQDYLDVPGYTPFQAEVLKDKKELSLKDNLNARIEATNRIFATVPVGELSNVFTINTILSNPPEKVRAFMLGMLAQRKLFEQAAINAEVNAHREFLRKIKTEEYEGGDEELPVTQQDGDDLPLKSELETEIENVALMAADEASYSYHLSSPHYFSTFLDIRIRENFERYFYAAKKEAAVENEIEKIELTDELPDPAQSNGGEAPSLELDRLIATMGDNYDFWNIIENVIGHRNMNILRLHYSRTNDPETRLTYAQMGDRYGITRKRIEQILRKKRSVLRSQLVKMLAPDDLESLELLQIYADDSIIALMNAEKRAKIVQE